MNDRPLYIFLRSDMASMTPGRAAAQAAHAANMFIGDFKKYEEYADIVDAWERQTNHHCGTTIILNGGSQVDMNRKMDDIVRESNGDMLYGFFIDTEYPIRDGETTHIIPDVLTALYIFPIGDDWSYMKKYDLY